MMSDGTKDDVLFMVATITVILLAYGLLLFGIISALNYGNSLCAAGV